MFGCAVSISENWAIVGAEGWVNGHGIKTGAAYLYKRSGDSWIEAQILSPGISNENLNALYGHTVAIDGDTLIIGSPGYNLNQGSVYIYKHKGNYNLSAQKLQYFGDSGT